MNNSGGNFMKTKKLLSFCTAIAMSASCVTAAYAQHTAYTGYGDEWKDYVSTQEQTFSDVPYGHWAKDNIDRAVAKKWFSGYPDGTFHPDASITRAEAMTVFVNFLGLPLLVSDESSYSDVKPSDWYAPYIEGGRPLFPDTAVYNGQKLFQPNMPMTREDTVYALVTGLRYGDDTINADQSVLNMFTDKNSISENIKSYMAVAVNKGLVSGFDDGTIGAQDPLTRAEFATLLYRASFVGFGTSDLDFGEKEVTVTSVSVTPSNTYQMTVGESFNISAIATMSDGTLTDYSDNLSPMTTENNIVISGRTVKAVSAGTATIKFLNDSKLSNTSITVVVTKPTGAPIFEEIDHRCDIYNYTVDIWGVVSDPNDSELELMIDGIYVPITDGRFKQTLPLKKGTNEYVLTLTNEYDIQSTKTVKFVFGDVIRRIGYAWSVSSLELNVGQTASVKLMEVYDNGTQIDVTAKYPLISDNTNIAKIDSYGRITALAPGKTTITFNKGTAIVDFLPSPINITVKGQPPVNKDAVITAYEWSVSELELEEGETAAIKLFEVYSDGTKKDCTNKFTLSSSNKSVASISGGTIKALSPGTAKISFASTGIGATVSMPRQLTVTVKGKTSVNKDAVITAYEWSVSELELEEKETAAIKLFEVYSDGTKKECTSKFTLSSSNTAVAAVSNGKITALSPGTTKISFASAGIGATVSMPRPLSVTVKAGAQPVPTLIGLEWSVPEITVKAGYTTTVKLYGVYSDGSRKDLSDECGLYADDENIAVIKGNTVRGITKGTTEAWFESLPKANITMPGTIKINVTN
jgi:hypothetical protein